MADQWYYRMLGEQFGPVDFGHLFDLANNGTIGPQDEVRSADGEWVAAESIVGLISASSGEQPAEKPQPSAAPGPVSTPKPTASAKRSARARSRPPAAKSNYATQEELVWECRILGQQIGPFSFDDLLTMVRADELGPSDEVRMKGKGDWSPADSIVGLFPDPPALSAGTAGSTVKETHSQPSSKAAPAASKPAPSQPRGRDSVTKPQSSAASESPSRPADAAAGKPSAASSTSPAAPPAAAQPPSTPSPAATSPAATSPAAASPAARRAAFVPPKKKKSAGFRLPSFDFSSLTEGESAAALPKLAIAVVVLIGVVFVFYNPLGGASQADATAAVDQMATIVDEIEKLAASGAGKPQWNELGSRVGPRSQQLAAELEDQIAESSGTTKSALKEVHQIAAYQVERTIESQGSTEELEALRSGLSTARNYLAAR